MFPCAKHLEAAIEALRTDKEFKLHHLASHLNSSMERIRLIRKGSWDLTATDLLTLEKEYGIRPEYLLHGTPPIFYTGPVTPPVSKTNLKTK